MNIRIHNINIRIKYTHTKPHLFLPNKVSKPHALIQDSGEALENLLNCLIAERSINAESCSVEVLGTHRCLQCRHVDEQVILNDDYIETNKIRIPVGQLSPNSADLQTAIHETLGLGSQQADPGVICQQCNYHRCAEIRVITSLPIPRYYYL